MEPKYVVNVIFQEPTFSKEFGSRIILKQNGEEFNKYKDAIEKYNKFIRQGVIKFPSLTGEIAFTLIAVEFIDVKKYKKELEKQQEELNNGTESGEEQYANDAESNSEDESETK